MEHEQLAESLAHARGQFEELVESVRPELHRYCARLMGSVIDGEDIVQETLAKAFYALSLSDEVPPLRPWLFRIAHNCAIDALRRHEHRFVDHVGESPESAKNAEASDPFAVRAALGTFLALPVAQRSAVILKDVLGYSLEEIAELTDSTVPAVKALLSRGRGNLRAHVAKSDRSKPEPNEGQRALLHRYAQLFNARDWDGLRSLIREDCRLDLVSKSRRQGQSVGEYFSRYARLEGLRVVVAELDGLPVLAMYSGDDAHPSNFILVGVREGRVADIRDFRYVPYIGEEVAAGNAVLRTDKEE
jgi:RNA polymerase sigma-70 factor (ECF subfamily)